MISLFTAMLAWTAAGPGTGEDLVRRWTFDSAEGTQGWSIGNDLKNLRVEAGSLRMELTGPDAFLFGPPMEAPLDGCVVRVRLRCERDGQTQVYWTTPDYPHFGEGQVDTQFSPGSHPAARQSPEDGWIVLTFPIGKSVDADRTLTRIRIDPCNGNTSGTVEIGLIEILRPPPVYEVRLSAEAHQIDPGRPVQVRVLVTQRSGRAGQETVEVVPVDGEPQRLSVTTQPASTAVGLQVQRPGVHRERVRVRDTEARITHDLETSVIVGRGERLPLIPALRSERVRIDFVPAGEGRLIGAARWMVATGSGEWKLAGWLLPLIDVSARGPDAATIIQRQPSLTLLESSERVARLGGAVDGLPGWAAQVQLELAEKDGVQCVEVTAVLSPPDGAELLDFSGPVVLVDREGSPDPLERFAIFGGLEFLEPGWESSSERAVGHRFADRWTPHPYKITLPVMAVEAAGVTSVLMWNPLDEWAAPAAPSAVAQPPSAEPGSPRPPWRPTMPAATFASPNFLDGQDNHLFKLSVPAVPEWREENESLARKPYLTRSDRPLTLRYRLLAEPEVPVVAAGKRWYDLYGVPAPPPAPTSDKGRPHDDRTWYDIIARNYGETSYWEDEQGWRAHWWHSEKSSSFIPFMAGTLIAHAAETGERRWVERTRLAGRTVIDTMGPLAGRLAADGHIRRLLAAMRPDGTWPFVNTDKMKADTRWHTQGEYETLGEDGSTSLGTCVQPALVVLRHGQFSGDPAFIGGGLKALEAMKQFRVPRGAQVWEVHQQIPDIRAASLAVEAYRIGYELTGDPGWLDEAAYWAYSGLPFIYSWRVPVEESPGGMFASTDPRDDKRMLRPLGEGFQNPDRQIMPYATVPVLGPTFYVVNWFGVVVQWLGFEWAMHVLDLDTIRPDPLLQYIANGVVASGLQQVFDRPPWVGLYPDVWDTHGNVATGAYISSMLPMYALQVQGRIPAWTKPWTRVLRPQFSAGSADSWHVSGWGVPLALDRAGRLSWTAAVRFLPGQPNELVLANVDAPQRVRIDSELLDRRPHDGERGVSGWHYDEARRAVVARFIQQHQNAELRVDW